MIRLIGVILVMTSVVGAFGSLRRALLARHAELLDWLRAVRLLEREIGFGVLPLGRICEKIAIGDLGVARDFFAELAAMLNGGNKQGDVGFDVGFEEAWQHLTEKLGAGWHLLAEDYAVLADLGRGLGKSDLAGQRRLLQLAEESLGSLVTESETKNARLLRLLAGLGWCCGLLIVCFCI